MNGIVTTNVRLIHANFDLYNRRLFTLYNMLRQLSARHSDNVINSICGELEQLYSKLSKMDGTGGLALELVDKAMQTIKLFSLNASITYLQTGNTEATPICSELQRFAMDIVKDIQVETESTDDCNESK